MPNFLEFIKREARFFVFSRSLIAVVIGFISWPCLLYLLDLYDSVSPIREGNAFAMVASITVVSLIVFCIFLLRSWIAKPSVKDLAKQVENANPDLQDLLNCAVELEDESRQRTLSFMEKRVLRQAEKKAMEITWSQGTRPKARFWISLALGTLTGLLLTGWSVGQSPLQKSFDALSGEPGLLSLIHI